jgi:two-component system chemotaxis response regulator CheY
MWAREGSRERVRRRVQFGPGRPEPGRGSGNEPAQAFPSGRRGQNMAVDKNMKVLIVDDYQTMLRILRNLLKQLEFLNVEEAKDGSTALAHLRKEPYGLVISDWNMEPMTGIQLLREVRGDPKLKHIPFIMITAESKSENVITAKEAGVSNYIVKPFNAETLRAKLVSVLGEF